MTIYESKGIVERCLRWFGKGFGKQHTDLILKGSKYPV